MVFSQEELDLIAANGLNPEEVAQVLTMFPQSLETAIGHIVQLHLGRGQERSAPFVEPEAV